MASRAERSSLPGGAPVTVAGRAAAESPRGSAVAVKICGVTREQDARRCVELGADLIGLNFHPASPRCLSVERALAVRRAVGDGARIVGVFVHQTPEEASALAERVGLDLLQFHGPLPAGEALDRLAERSIVVLRPGREEELADSIARRLWAVLYDAPPALDRDGGIQLGGTGRSWDYGAVATAPAAFRRVLLAGGIGPGNARAAAAVEGVWGIDVCSGVESAPGVKDPAKLDELFGAVRGATAAAPLPGG